MNIERLFKEEVRDKKRIGSNIFSRVSTRKGGSNQALRTPYLYMKPKERRKLNGEVQVFNMNNIIKYEEFAKKPNREQRDLMIYWRDKFTNKEIRQGMNITNSTLYRLIDQLDIPKSLSNFNKKSKTLTDEEMDRYLNGEFIEFSLFKDIDRSQQIEIFKNYFEMAPSISELARTWGLEDKADINYLYLTNSRLKKSEAPEEDIKEVDNNNIMETKEDNVASAPQEQEGKPKLAVTAEDVQNVLELLKPETVEEDIEDDSVEEVTPDFFQPAQIPKGFEYDDEEMKEDAQEDNEGNSPAESKDDESSENALTFELKGRYSTKAILKCIQFTLETLDEESEVTDIDIKVRKR